MLATPACRPGPARPSLLTGLLFVGTCSYLAAVYLVGEAAHRGDRSLQHYFTRRAQAAAIITGALSLAALAELHISNPALFSRLTGRALPLVIIAGLCGLAVLGLLTASRPRGIRVPAALGVAAVIWGWGVAQYPELLPGTTMTLTGTGTPHATLVAIIWLSAAAVLIVGPAYALLFSLQGRQVLQAGDAEADFPAQPGSRGGESRTCRLTRLTRGELRQWRRPASPQRTEVRRPRPTGTGHGQTHDP